MDPKQRIKERFAANLERVRGLVASAEKLQGLDPRPRDEGPADVLRAAVVLLHATLEDLLRSLFELTLRRPGKGMLRDVKFSAENSDGPEKTALTPEELARRYRGRNVDDVLDELITAHLDHTNFSDLARVKATLMKMDIPAERSVSPHAGAIGAMMHRRHQIAHRADSTGSHPATFLQLPVYPIHQPEVVFWVDTVERFGAEVVSQFKESVP